MVVYSGACVDPGPLYLPQPSGGPGAQVLFAHTKKWLGWLWTAEGGEEETLALRLRTASGIFAPLSGLVACGSRHPPPPRPLSVREQDRWHPQPREVVVRVVPRRRALHGSVLCAVGALPPGVSAMALRWGLGWILTGSARIVLDVARRRAKLFLLPPDDFYRRAFMRSSQECPSSWGSRSRRLLQQWGLVDIVDGPSEPSYREYVRYVRADLLAQCAALVERGRRAHRTPLPHLELCPGPCCLHQLALRTALPWSCLHGLRAWSRIRAGLVALARQGSSHAWVVMPVSLTLTSMPSLPVPAGRRSGHPCRSTSSVPGQSICVRSYSCLWLTPPSPTRWPWQLPLIPQRTSSGGASGDADKAPHL